MYGECEHCKYADHAWSDHMCAPCLAGVEENWTRKEPPLTLSIKKLNPEAVIPEYAKEGDSGFDLVAVEDALLLPGETRLIKTGIAVELPPGTELQVRPRSGLSLKSPLHIRNAPGTVDNGYRGEIGVICHCLPTVDNMPTAISKGDRIAQGVVVPVIRCDILEVEELSDTARGADGYGSTGV